MSTFFNTEWMILTDYVTVLKPAAERLDISQGDGASLGYIMSVLFAIEKKSHPACLIPIMEKK